MEASRLEAEAAITSRLADDATARAKDAAHTMQKNCDLLAEKRRDALNEGKIDAFQLWIVGSSNGQPAEDKPELWKAWKEDIAHYLEM